MATKYDILTTPVAGYPYIDALLAAGPDWNFLTTDGTSFRTSLYYSFATNGTQYETQGLQGFNSAQQQATRGILASAGGITGINFVEVPTATAADLHFALANIDDLDLGGVCYADYSYTNTPNGQLSSYTADAYIYLDAARTTDTAPVAGSWWYQALLHEVGHALGLKHPFEATQGNAATLTAPYQDTTAHTVMSYTQTPNYHSQFSEYDLAALNFLYGGDGLRGEWGVGTTGLYLTGSSLDSAITLPQGKVTLDDLGGMDTVVYGSPRGDYILSPVQDNAWLHVLGTNVDAMISSSIEYLAFSDGVVSTASLLKPKGTFLFGSDQDNLLIGTAGDDILFGFGGNDILYGGRGDDRLYGSDGLDTARFNVSSHEAVIIRTETGWIVKDSTGTDTLDSIERLQFLDGNLALDLAPDQSAGMAALMVSAVLGKGELTNQPLLGEVISILDGGLGLHQLCNQLVASNSLSDAELANLLFHNVTGQQPQTTSQNTYLSLMQGHGGFLDQGELLAYVVLSPDNQDTINLAGLQQAGLAYL